MTTNEKQTTLNAAEYTFDASMVDESMIDGIDSEAKEVLESLETSTIPTFFPEAGRFTIRIFPDVHKQTGKIRMWKRACFQRILGLTDEGKEVRISCMDNPKVNNMLKNLESSGFKDAFKYKSREHAYVMCKLYECPDNKYYKPGDCGVLVLTNPQLEALINYWYSLSKQEKIDLLNTNADSYGITIDFSRPEGKRYLVASSIASSEVKVPLGDMMLPGGCKWEGLDYAYINERDNTLTDNQFNMFTKWANNKLISSHGYTTIDPTPTNNVGGHTMPNVDNSDDPFSNIGFEG